MADLLGTFEQIVLLAVLDLEDHAYGRSVLRSVESALARERSVAAGAVYATLDRMEQKGLLDSRLETATPGAGIPGDGTPGKDFSRVGTPGAGILEAGIPARGGRTRRYYRLTTSGITALNNARAAVDSMWRGKPWPLPTPA